MKINEAVVIPTGKDIKEGTVQDTNSPAVIFSIVAMAPLCAVRRETPVDDDENSIRNIVEHWADNGADLIVLIGGSGGGRRYSSTLSDDYTHTALESALNEKVSREIWGKNGHLWCKLVCGRKNGALIINVPGPYVEAKAAIEAFCRVYQENPNDLEIINSEMIRAVLAQYPDNVTG